MITLNNLNNAFNRIAVAHKQVNSYGFGDPLDMAVSGTTQYPMLWVIPKQIDVADGAVAYNFTFLFMDLVHKYEGNKIEVWNDQMLTALDFFAELSDPGWEFEFEHPDTSGEPFEEKGEDEVAGYSFDIKIRARYYKDACAIPSDTIVRTFLNEPGTSASYRGGSAGSSAGTIYVYVNGTLNQTITSNDLNAETITILP